MKNYPGIYSQHEAELAVTVIMEALWEMSITQPEYKADWWPNLTYEEVA